MAEKKENSTSTPTEPIRKEIVFLAETNFRNQRTKFGIRSDDRRRHTYLIGKTGMGKSTVMENMIIQDIRNGNGVALVDPHGDFAEKILAFIPSDRINDVVYFNPADFEYPIAFNVMESVSQEHKHLIASGLIGVFKKLWADSWGPRLEYVLRNTILALLDYPGSTLLGVMRLLVDKTYRAKVIEKIKDPVVKSFWVDEYSKYPQQFQAEAIAPIQNKVGQFLSTALIRNVVGQVKSTIDLREIMDSRKILIMNLSKGRIGEDASSLLGAIMITKIQLAAMSRIDTQESERKDFYLYVDEFQNFATESFANILSEARKYRLDLIIGHQYIEQLDETVQAAVFGNVGTIMCFRVGAGDAEFLAKEFAPYFTEEDLVNLAKYDIYMKLMINGIASNPFSATTLPPLNNTSETNNTEKIIKVSRERYSRPREMVEDKISRWSGMETSPASQTGKNAHQSPIAQTADDSRTTPKKDNYKNNINKAVYTASCYECGQSTEITFKPDGVRPIYCQTCFQKIKNKPALGEGVEEVVSEVPDQPEISLSEALSKKPVHFGQESRTNDRDDYQSKKKELPPRPNKNYQNPVPFRSNRPENITDKNDDDDGHSLQELKPGQTVKF